MPQEDPMKGIHLPKLSDTSTVSPPRALVDEMKHERRRVPPPPRGVTDDSLVAAHTKPSGFFGAFLDGEARQNNDPSNPYIRHGSLLVPRAHEAEFEKAERYLSKDAEAMGVLYGLEHDTHDHVMRIGDDVRSDETRGNIAWNPHLAARDEHGHSISPALSLLHEEDHAIENPDIKAQLVDANTNDDWDNLEEERVITGVENRAARILHEGVRDSHESLPDDAPLNQRGDYWVDSVASRTPSAHQKPLPSENQNYAPNTNDVVRAKSSPRERGR